MNTRELFNQSVGEISLEIKKEMDLSFAISDKLDSVLKEKNLTQKQFAKMVGKSEAEVCRWLSGRHNFTIRTLAKISVALGVDILQFYN